MAVVEVVGHRAAELITPAEVKELVPFIDETDRSSAASTRRASASSTRSRPARSCAQAAQEMGALTVSPQTEVTGLDVVDGRIPGVRTDRGDIATETVVIACGVWSPRIARDGRRLDPAHAGGPPDDRRRAGADLRAHRPARSTTRSSATSTRTCTSASTATSFEVGSYAHRPILMDADDIPSIAGLGALPDGAAVHPGRLRPAARARARALPRRSSATRRSA